MKRPVDVDMRGKVCVVTGANGGIGLETTVALARMGADVVMICRSKDKGEAALAEVKRRAGSEKVSLLLADLSSLADIRRVAADFLGAHDRLDVLVNNAGAMHQVRKATVDGLETTFAGNHLSYFLLTHELLPLLKKSAPSRIVNTASSAHVGMRIDFDDLQAERGPFIGFNVYGTSKLANVMFTYELARRLEGTGVTANCLHPGFVGSAFGKNDPGIVALGLVLMKPFIRSPDRGSWTTIHLATAPELATVTGKYFSNLKETRSSGASRDVTAQKRLWDVSEQLCGV